jgi:hypothetical protein
LVLLEYEGAVEGHRLFRLDCDDDIVQLGFATHAIDAWYAFSGPVDDDDAGRGDDESDD